jgi:3-oxoacyl-[acyl-carrier protein] reductase
VTDAAGRRVAVVTGGSRGIGRAIALRLARSDHAVAINYSSNPDAADEVVKRITNAGGVAIAHRANVAKADEVSEMFERIAGDLGAVSVLVNNAGITRDNLLLRMTTDDFDDVIAVNLRSAYLCTKAALRGMVKARWGRVISIASVAGIVGNAGQANYSASKAGLIGFSKALSKEYGSRGITVNVVAPGFISTDMTQDLDGAARAKAIEGISLGRFGEADEIAAAVQFLSSDDAGYITAQVLSVEGGITL